MSNNSYDFKSIKDKVDLAALKDMFCEGFKTNAPRQSSVFMAHLRQVCEQLKYHEFHTELMEFIQQEQLENLMDLDQVDKIHTDLQIKMFEEMYRANLQ